MCDIPTDLREEFTEKKVDCRHYMIYLTVQ